MKIKHGVLLFALGSGALIVATLFKLMHWAGSVIMLFVSTVLIGAGGLVVIVKLLMHHRARRFFNL